MMTRLIIKLALLALLVPVKLFSQEFSGTAIYESKTSFENLKAESDEKEEDAEMTKMITEMVKKQLEKKFILNFNKYESIYEQEQKLEAPTANSGGFAIKIETTGAGGGKTYKNVKEKVEISEEDFFGKEFLVTDSLKVWNWQLTHETKKIGDYTCYKAICVEPVSEADLKQYEDFKKQQETSKTTFLVIDEPKDRVTTVWYTPEIPVSHGPSDLWGLPGLILEANFDKTVILCSKIVLNPKGKAEIKRPKRGRKVTKKEYEVLMEKQLDQMKDENGAFKIQIAR